MKNGDIVVDGGRVWRVVGIYYGDAGQEDAVGITAVDRGPPFVDGKFIEEMIVPMAFVFGKVYGPRTIT